ncbi:T9SS type B sorting domain-containing protein [Roseivirga misakiensis]|uniref:Fibronectin type-III domain-containing protein n=1 Tax=Roseivirga misakiensis TaxID=1563681 RepID=A0A1E5T4A6_9BACT|nr:gliding motility-associated C-terminal domain-containing protein [Roseivirga misakiensis]OEK06214.1 hypothetical protein BFP71_00620 [Roseivirga misakiensis]
MHTSKRLAFLAVSCLVILSCSFSKAYATHIRAGDVCIELISQTSLTYRFTFTIYTDLGSEVRVGQGNPIVRFGDGTTIEGEDAILARAESISRTVINNEVGKVVMVFVHTYQAPRTYVASYTEQNRNAGIVNIPNSVDTPFHIQGVTRIEAGNTVNSSPKLSIPPIDRACVGRTYFHNPGAFDPDGDSLVFKIVLPQLAPNLNIVGYTDLNDPLITNEREDGTSPALIQIDQETGLLTWDAPQFVGEYNVAFIVEEWRFSELRNEWIQLGFITRDMQILVEDDCQNERPEIVIPNDLCMEAGTNIREIILGSDPDGHRISLEAFGSPFEITNSPATVSPDQSFIDSPQEYEFNWQTNTSHIRERPYQVQFKISDDSPDTSGPSLSEFATWNITVVAPAPTGLSGAVTNGGGIQLVWDQYQVSNLDPVIQVWRRIDSFDFSPTDCNTGIPDGAYELITEVPSSQTNTVDNNNVRAGTNYCYRLVAKFPLPLGGESYASTEFCISTPIDRALITNVSIEETDQTNGEIFIKWTSPLDIDDDVYPPPYQYSLMRFEGQSGTANGTLVTTTQDNSFVDTNLNTLNDTYNYRVELYTVANPNNLIAISEPASTVRLSALAVQDAIEVNWRANVPWNNQVSSAPYHYIYRNRTDTDATDLGNFVLIDSVDTRSTSFVYTDNGRFNNIPLKEEVEYCYFVTTQGSYGNDRIESPLQNNSQEICAVPGDEVPPINPDILVDNNPDRIDIDGNSAILITPDDCQNIANTPCNYDNFSNTVEWVANSTDNDLAGYRVYFSESGLNDSFSFLAFTEDTEYAHNGLSSLKGCYRITTVDRSGNESDFSETICFDNCPYYRLPNTFTPNADTRNDTFSAFNEPNSECPRFVKEVEFRVFNRWGGKEIYSYSTCGETEPDIFINWDGRDKNGKVLPEGTYYYHAVVTFDVLDEAKRTQEFRNWVKIIR